MPELTLPVVAVKDSFLAAMAEFVAEGRGTDLDDSMVGREIAEYGPTWTTDQGFAAYVADLRAHALEETPRPQGYVPSTTFWWIEGSQYLGRIAVRHRLTPWLLDQGGHIGYDVRPSARRRGHATAMLRAVLPYAASLGIEQALVTCDDDNVASRKVIEAAGGIFEDQRGRKLRYWVSTRP
jgi:predicted acetyltransferase